jgi:small GTP-binding protein
MGEMDNFQAKICTVGDFAVGKSSLVQRYVEGVFGEQYLSTIGVWISRKIVEVKEVRASMILWDLAGGENDLGAQFNYLQGAAGVIIVCDLTRAETLTNVKKTFHELYSILPQAEILLIGNKSDLDETREVSDEIMQELAAELNCDLFITSAKTGANVENMFFRLAEKLLASRRPPQK